MLILYQFFLLLFGLLYLAARLARGRRMGGWRERLAWYPADLRARLVRLDQPIWIHLVSVGEVIAARPLVEELRRRFPEKNWVITTVTGTGRSVAKGLAREGRDELLYLPWDFSAIVRRAVRLLRPALFLSFETELWPVLFRELSRSGTPVAVVNGRISPHAYRRYLWIRPLMQRALAPVDLFLIQSAQDARRFAAIGAAKDRLVVTGNLKWDLQPLSSGNGLEPDRLKSLLSLGSDDLLWTAGSTHPGEEEALLRVYGRLRTKHPNVRLLIAPRHPERAAEVEGEVIRAGLKPVRWSQARGVISTLSEAKGRDLDFKSEISRPLRQAQGARDDAEGVQAETVVLLDTLGELTAFYRISDLVFVGGSLVPHGGHNLVEPAALSRSIITGPHLQNFQAVSEALLQAGGLAVVRSESELEEKIRRFLGDPSLSREMGRRANAVFQENQGAARRTADLIELRWGRKLKDD